MSLKTKAASLHAIALVRKAIHRPPTDDDGLPDAVVDWLARLRLLSNVPFAYLVPDHRLLPTESIRFFYLNRNWTDAAVDGAMSVGAVTTKDRAQLQGLHATLRAAVDRHERRVWAKDAGAAPTDGPAEVVTGFLLRSRAVSGWPGPTRPGVARRTAATTAADGTTGARCTPCSARRNSGPGRHRRAPCRSAIRRRPGGTRTALRVTLDRGAQSRHRSADGHRAADSAVPGRCAGGHPCRRTGATD